MSEASEITFTSIETVSVSASWEQKNDTMGSILYFTRLFTRKANSPSACIRIEVIFILFDVHTQNLSLFKDRCVTIAPTRCQSYVSHTLWNTFYLDVWWWTFAMNWMTYDQYIFYDASVNNPPLCLHVYRCVSILYDRCPEMFIYLFFSLPLVGSSFMCQFSWFY